MKRPLASKRPLGPFAQAGEDCTITFTATYRLTGSEDVQSIMEEFVDNMEARLNTLFENQFNMSPVDSVEWANQDGRTFRFFVNTDLRRFTDQMEDEVLDEFEEELLRLTDGMVVNEGYQYVV